MSAKCPPQNWADTEKSGWCRQNVRPLSARLSGVLSALKVTMTDMEATANLSTLHRAAAIVIRPKAVADTRWKASGANPDRDA
jgi:hypothetical protein